MGAIYPLKEFPFVTTLSDVHSCVYPKSNQLLILIIIQLPWVKNFLTTDSGRLSSDLVIQLFFSCPRTCSA